MNTQVIETPGRLSFKRLMLRALVVSLATCALVAVGALLLGKFDETTVRILLTLGALALHSGVAMACAASLERRLWPRLSLLGLLAFGINFCVLISCIWWPGGLDTPAVRAFLTTGVVLATYIVAIPSADLYDRRYAQPVAMAGMAACVAALVMTLVCIWSEWTDDLTFAKATGIVAVGAFSLAHTCIVVRVPRDGALIWLVGGTLVFIWTLAAMWSTAIVIEPTDEMFFRVFGAVGVLDATGSLALLILAKLRRMARPELMQSTAVTLELHCPRCRLEQVVPAGKSQCSACGLKFTVEIEEPRCPKCDYLLWQLPERRCPECGTPF
ncbi:MAG: hypothetical protein PVJ57_09555 [Phycisphaerae bacterium]|jgi:hypothetical protein